MIVGKLARLVLAGLVMAVTVHSASAVDAGSAAGASDAPGNGANFDHAGVANDVIEHYLRPKSQAFAADADSLRKVTAAACAKPTKSSVAAAVEAMKVAALSYAQLELLRIGPTRDANRQERLLLYPDRKGLVRKHVEKAIAQLDTTVTSVTSLRDKSVSLQGFPALEVLLGAGAAEKLLSRSEESRFRCAFMTAIGANIAEIGEGIRDDWADDDGFAKLLRNPGASNAAYLKAEEVSLEVFNAFANGLEQVRDIRIAAPIGLKALDKAPTPGVLQDVALTLSFVAANIDGLIALYHDGGLKSRMAVKDDAIADLIERELVTARDLARSVQGGTNLATLAAKEKSKLVAMGFPLKNAKQLATTLFADATGLTVGFNAGDGD